MSVLYTILIVLFCVFAPRRFYRIGDKHNDDPIEEWFLGWVVIIVIFLIGVGICFLYLKIDSTL